MNPSHSSSNKRTAILALGALGVVFGDIGTSPLYALRECLGGHTPIAVTHDHILGILSLIIWSLILLISVKYVSLVMRADNQGEGGMLAMLALGFPQASPSASKTGRYAATMFILALLGTAFLYGDGIITPAISVLSAVEGLKVTAPQLDHLLHSLFPAWSAGYTLTAENLSPSIVPITVTILIGLFSIQHRGTGLVGNLFGPITLIWFIAIGILGIRGILLNPYVFHAFNPWYAINFVIQNHLIALATVGSVFLCVTGGEALYADMGHFGRIPIRLAWFAIVQPALILNYLGQGALVLSDPTVATDSPFHRLAPEWFQMPLVILGAIAAVIASQALISGAFSLTMQAIQMGFIPRIRIQHTSESEVGQIYLSSINRALMVGSIALVIHFQTSSALAHAYGIAVCLTMLITTILMIQIARRCWNWSMPKIAIICGIFLLIESCFAFANLSKIMHGGFIPILIGATLLFVMLTWKRGRDVLSKKYAAISIPVEDLIVSFQRKSPTRVPGTAVYMTSSPIATPGALLHNLKHNKVLHDKVIILSLASARVPRVHSEESLKIQDLGNGVWRVIATCGFMEQPKVPSILKRCSKFGLECNLDKISYFLGRETIVATSKNMPVWQARFFSLLCRSSQSAMEFFQLPPNKVIELGAQIEL